MRAGMNRKKPGTLSSSSSDTAPRLVVYAALRVYIVAMALSACYMTALPHARIGRAEFTFTVSVSFC